MLATFVAGTARKVPMIDPSSVPRTRKAKMITAVGSRFPEELEEELEGSRRVSDGEDEVVGILELVPTQAFSYGAAPAVANL
jgi:hypothetical protein